MRPDVTSDELVQFVTSMAEIPPLELSGTLTLADPPHALEKAAAYSRV